MPNRDSIHARHTQQKIARVSVVSSLSRRAILHDERTRSTRRSIEDRNAREGCERGRAPRAAPPIPASYEGVAVAFVRVEVCPADAAQRCRLCHRHLKRGGYRVKLVTIPAPAFRTPHGPPRSPTHRSPRSTPRCRPCQRAPPPRGLETILESAQCEIEGLHDVVRQQMHVQGVLENERSAVLERRGERAHRAAR